jgi:hypothetical protein
MGRYTYLVEKHDQPDEKRPEPTATQAAQPAGTPVPPVRGVPLKRKRVMKQRQPFDIYQDQYDALKRIALEERMQGGVGSISGMVRDAIDKIIAEKRPENPKDRGE